MENQLMAYKTFACLYMCRNPSFGLASRQGLAKVRAKSEAQESHFMLSGVWEKAKE
jgi:hypothetical protein